MKSIAETDTNHIPAELEQNLSLFPTWSPYAWYVCYRTGNIFYSSLAPNASFYF